MIKVSEYYNKVYEIHGKHIASRFYFLMCEWDGMNSVWNAFYDESVLSMKLKEALE